MASNGDDTRDGDDLRDDDSSNPPFASSRQGSNFPSRQTRGPNRNIAWAKLPLGVRPDVEVDAQNRPVGESGAHYARYLGTLARDLSLCPFHHTGWHEVPQKTKELIWSRIQGRCNVSEALRDWSIMEVGERWKAYKYRLKRNYYRTSSSAEVCMKKKPKEIPQDQWHSLIDYWESELSKARTDKAKAARSMLTIKHTMGSIGFAAHGYNFTRAKGRAPTKIELWKHCHTKKSGDAVDPESQRIMDKMDAISKLPSSFRSSSFSLTSPDEIFNSVMSQERNGHLHCMGKEMMKTKLHCSSSQATFSMNEEQVRNLVREEMKQIQEQVDKRIEQQFVCHQIAMKQLLEEQFTSQERVLNERLKQQFASQQRVFQEQMNTTFERLIAIFQRSGSDPRSSDDSTPSKARRNLPPPSRRHLESEG